jgi:hypothetical protein
MTITGPDARTGTPGQAMVNAAMLVLERMGLTPADLLAAPAAGPHAQGPEGTKSTDGHGRQGRKRCGDRPEERSVGRSARAPDAGLAFYDACALSSSPSPSAPD